MLGEEEEEEKLVENFLCQCWMKGITPQDSQDRIFYLLSKSFHYFTL